MRQNILLACFLLPALALAQGVKFEHDLPFADALQKAKAEGKLVFMDAYTSWCGPCKMMTKTFPDPAVGALFNARFVNLKTDMEKGEGPALALRYGVEYYPTLLFINAQGEVAHKAVGYHNVEDFLKLANTAVDSSANLLALQTRYRKGERSAALLRALTETKSAA